MAEDDIHGYARLNRQFHLLMCDSPHTQWTLRLTSSLTAQTSAVRRGFKAIPGRMKASLVEHERRAGAALIAALSEPRKAAE